MDATPAQRAAIAGAAALPASWRHWAAAIARRESAWNPELIHPTSEAAGVWQIVPVLLAHYRKVHPRARPMTLTDPADNLRVFTWYWGWLGRLPWLPAPYSWRVHAYVTGPGRVKEALQGAPARRVLGFVEPPWLWATHARDQGVSGLVVAEHKLEYTREVTSWALKAEADEATLRKAHKRPALWALDGLTAMQFPDIAERAWQLWRPTPGRYPRAFEHPAAKPYDPDWRPRWPEWSDRGNLLWARVFVETGMLAFPDRRMVELREWLAGPDWSAAFLAWARSGDPKVKAWQLRRFDKPRAPSIWDDLWQGASTWPTDVAEAAADVAEAAAEELGEPLDKLVSAGLTLGLGYALYKFLVGRKQSA